MPEYVEREAVLEAVVRNRGSWGLLLTEIRALPASPRIAALEGEVERLRGQCNESNENLVRIRDERDAAVAMLREVEWVDADESDTFAFCQLCERSRLDGHASDCRLAAMLNDNPQPKETR